MSMTETNGITSAQTSTPLGTLPVVEPARVSMPGRTERPADQSVPPVEGPPVRSPQSPPARRRWPAVAGVVAALAVSGSLLGYGMNQRSAAADWKAEATAKSELLSVAQADLATARTATDEAAKARDAAVADASTVRSDLSRVTSLRDQMRTQLVAAGGVFGLLDDCVARHDALIATLVDFTNGAATQAALQSAITAHDSTCSAAYATARQWAGAVSALGI